MSNNPKGPKWSFNKAAFTKVAIWTAVAGALYFTYSRATENTAAQATKQIAEQVEAEKRMMVPYTDFVHMSRAHEFKLIDRLPDGNTYMGTNGDVVPPRMTIAPSQEKLLADLDEEFKSGKLTYNVMPQDKKPDIQISQSSGGSGGGLFGGGIMGLVIGAAVSAVVFLLIMSIFQRMRGGPGAGGGNPLQSFGKSKARMLDENNNRVTFADVAGCDEAKEEVKEVVDFLRDTTRFQRMGAKIPRGLLLVGPPGTGKTLLAKSIAGEAKVPFFSISGSDFVEMFVGVGASRVRDMFENAKKNAPCIIFIDEIDAVGRQRGSGMGGGNDEREQTLNQMLVEMDGFETNLGVIVVAATNRPDILDAALLRPGRFDRQVYVTLPDIKGREQILAVHMRKIPMGTDINPNVIARGTPGMSGADLANLCNEAAVMAVRRNARVVEMQDFEKAKDRIFMGPERKSMVMPLEERRNTAYHEAGHALIGKLLPKCDPVHKVSIMPRGRALGVTLSLPQEDRYGYDAEFMRQQISMLFGGRIAEEIFMNQKTTGASNDFERATKLARDMVMKYGMTDAMGPMVYTEGEGQSFLGQSMGRASTMSEKTLQEVDAEVRRIIDEQYNVARKLIEDHPEAMHAMARMMLEFETIDGRDVDDLIDGKEEIVQARLREAARVEHKERLEVTKARLAADIATANDNADLPPPEKKGLFPFRGPK